MEVRAPPHYYYYYYHHQRTWKYSYYQFPLVYDSTINFYFLRHRFVGIKVTLIHIADEFRNCANYGKLGPIVMWGLAAV
jgi:hypothetical protein